MEPRISDVVLDKMIELACGRMYAASAGLYHRYHDEYHALLDLRDLRATVKKEQHGKTDN